MHTLAHMETVKSCSDTVALQLRSSSMAGILSFQPVPPLLVFANFKNEVLRGEGVWEPCQ